MAGTGGIKNSPDRWLFGCLACRLRSWKRMNISGNEVLIFVTNVSLRSDSWSNKSNGMIYIGIQPTQINVSGDADELRFSSKLHDRQARVLQWMKRWKHVSIAARFCLRGCVGSLLLHPDRRRVSNWTSLMAAFVAVCVPRTLNSWLSLIPMFYLSDANITWLEAILLFESACEHPFGSSKSGVSKASLTHSHALHAQLKTPFHTPQNDAPYKNYLPRRYRQLRINFSYTSTTHNSKRNIALRIHGTASHSTLILDSENSTLSTLFLFDSNCVAWCWPNSWANLRPWKSTPVLVPLRLPILFLVFPPCLDHR